MCGRYVLQQNLAEICAAFGVSTALKGLEASWNAAPESKRPIIVKNRLGEAQWGWPVSDDMKPVINIRSETAAEKAMFSRAWQAGQRCVVPASGFYEWDASGQPFFAHAPDAPLMGFCGLWTRDFDAGVRFGILTRAALPHLAPIHPRMPVTIAPQAAQDWLKGGNWPQMPLLRVYPVGRGVNTIANNSPSLLDALAAAPQGNLFQAAAGG